MHQVFRLHESSAENTGTGEIRVSVRCSCEPYGTSLLQVLRQGFPAAAVRPGRKTIAALFDNRGEFIFSGELPSLQSVSDVLGLLGELLTARDQADVSHCLDLYKVPDDEIPPDDWPYTEVGRLLYRAKYKHNLAAARRLGNQLVGIIRRHPAFSRADVVCAMPSSGSGSHFDSARLWRGMIRAELGLRAVDLVRTRAVVQQKAIESVGERARNQLDSMDCEDVPGATVLVIDDLYMSGETMKEAVRVLRGRGALRVFALCAVKTATGTQGGVQGLFASAVNPGDWPG
jgi:hypothetical protein